MRHDRYESPLSSRYASDEMQYIFSPDKKFRTWRRLWIALAETERELGLNITEEQIEELKEHADDINYDVAKEREKIMFLKMRATYILDTSKLLTRELKIELEKIFVEGRSFCNLYITVMSFGFKYGIPQDSDLVFDVRFLPNPYYIDDLREKTGNDAEVQDYVMENEKSRVFLDKLRDMVEFLIPNYILEGKNQLVISIGCTGGKHRSVTLANVLYQMLEEQGNYGVRIEHRDIGKDTITKRK